MMMKIYVFRVLTDYILYFWARIQNRNADPGPGAKQMKIHCGSYFFKHRLPTRIISAAFLVLADFSLNKVQRLSFIAHV
jgi:hypothetical protein